MHRLDKIYRTNYTGENVTTLATYKGSTWEYQSEWVPMAVENRQTSRVATVIGNGESRAGFELFLLTNHKAGVLGSRSMQTYGCNAVYRDANPTFLVASTDHMCDELVASGYCDDHIVYANSTNVLKYPGKFYLIPQDVQSNAGTIATYLAAFDGHEAIYLLGFDGQTTTNYNSNVYAGTACYQDRDTHVQDDYMINSLTRVMTTYSEITFIRVMPTRSWQCPQDWLNLPNFRQIDFRDFVLEVDL